jgi:hypothetical protein
MYQMSAAQRNSTVHAEHGTQEGGAVGTYARLNEQATQHQVAHDEQRYCSRQHNARRRKLRHDVQQMQLLKCSELAVCMADMQQNIMRQQRRRTSLPQQYTAQHRAGRNVYTRISTMCNSLSVPTSLVRQRLPSW